MGHQQTTSLPGKLEKNIRAAAEAPHSTNFAFDQSEGVAQEDEWGSGERAPCCPT